MGMNNIYNVAVKVEDPDGESDTKSLTVTVTNVNERPTITSTGTTHTAPSFDENTDAATVVATYTATDVDAGTVLTWSLQGDDSGRFTITKNTAGEGELTFNNSPDFEDPADTDDNNEYDVTVKVTDNHSPQMEHTVDVVVTVNDVNERPIVSGDDTPTFQELSFDLDPSTLTADVYEVTTFTAEDDDPDDTLTWSLQGDDDEHFAIDPNTGVLTFDIAAVTHPVTGDQTPRPDFEDPDDTDTDSNNTYEITVVATDSNPGDSSHAEMMGTFDVVVTVTNLNEIPVLLGDTFTFDFPEIEYDDDGPVPRIATFATYDEEQIGLFSGVAGGDDDDLLRLLAISGHTAKRLVFPFHRPDYEMPRDADDNNVYEATVYVSDGSGSDRRRLYDVVVTVTDVDETPEITNPPADDLDFEETPYDSNVEPDVVATFTARDEENDDLTWTLSGVDAGDFVITENDDGEGVVTFAVPPDFENPADEGSDNRYEFRVEATDPGSNTGYWDYAVEVSDVNEVPEFTGTPATAVSYDENATVDVASYSARDEEAGVTWSLTGVDSDLFMIDSGGTVTFNDVPDWENPVDGMGDNTYRFRVVATDVESGPTRLRAGVDVVVTVADVEEPGIIEVSIPNPAADVDEILFTLSDPDGGIVLTAGVLNWDIQRRLPMGDWTNKVDGGPLLLTTGYRPDEDDTGYEIRAVVTYTDRRGSGKTAESEATAAVTANPIINAPPRVTAGSCDVAEGPAGRDVCDRVQYTDRDGDTVTFAMGESLDAALFEVDASTGQLRAVEALDFETTTGQLLAPVLVADGRDADGNVEVDFVSDGPATFVINVLDVEEDGVVTLSVVEPAVGDTVTASLADGDGSISGLVWRWARSVNGRTGWVIVSGETSDRYTTSQNDANFFLRAVATYSDNRGDNKRAEAVTERVFGQNQRPTFPTSETGQRTVAENARGVNVGAAVAATDPDRDPLTYSLTGADAAAFTIVASTGQIRTKDALDFETKSSYTFTVEVHDRKDGQGAPSTTIDDTQSVTVTVDNVDEPGEITLSTLTATISARVEVTAVLNDPDGPSNVSWQWWRSGDGRSNWARISGATSEQYTPTLADAGNYLRADAAYTDGHGVGKAAQKVSPRVSDPPPINAAPAFGATETGRREIAENATGGDPVGDPVTAGDANNDPLTYTLSGSDAAVFAIDSATGQLRVAPGAQLDFETKRSYRVVVSVSDGADAADDPDNDAIDDTITVTITLIDVNEAPVVTGDTGPAVAENTTAAVATYRGADPERDTLVWSVNNDVFWVSGRGQLYFASPPSFEDATSYQVTVTAADPEGLSDTLAVTVTVTDLEEPGVVGLTPLRGWVGTRFAASLTDDDGNTSNVSWQWSRSRSRTCSPTGGDDIALATSATYTATDDDTGHYLRATASYRDRRGSNKEACAVLAARIADSADRPPSNTAPEFADTSVTRSIGQGTAPTPRRRAGASRRRHRRRVDLHPHRS